MDYRALETTIFYKAVANYDAFIAERQRLKGKKKRPWPHFENFEDCLARTAKAAKKAYKTEPMILKTIDRIIIDRAIPARFLSHWAWESPELKIAHKKSLRKVRA